ncbi:hypothetical protein MMC10_003485 [Thelotrema lepadinum]|nr:hypothetical protein [Thelotrema lepadinum]
MHPSVEDFKSLLESSPQIMQLAKLMFEQIPEKPSFDKDILGRPSIRSHHALLTALDNTLSQAPEWECDKPIVEHLPLAALLDLSLSTTSGHAFFRNPLVNAKIGAILNVWNSFLSSPASANVLNTSPRGWFSPSALSFIMKATADHPPGTRHFEQEFVCDPSQPHYGFTSWNAFFTRALRPGIRPVADATDWNVITAACEAEPYQCQTNVQASDIFNIKQHAYSLQDMLAHHPLASHFAGGTVYQGYLDPGSYHRWHSPVDGRVVAVHLQPGTYFSKLVQPTTNTSPLHSRDGGGGDIDKRSAESPHPVRHGEPPPFQRVTQADSQSYLAHVATRALIFVEADNPAIGLMCVMPVGWVEVSTCVLDVKEGDRVAKGDQLGMFCFGGSSHCLLFRPQTRLRWDLRGQTPGPGCRIIPVRSRIAVVGGDEDGEGGGKGEGEER